MNTGVMRSPRAILRLVLYRGEVYRVPEAGSGIRIREGQAWVSYAGKDLVLPKGEVLWFISGKDAALVSSVGPAPLILEILGDYRRLSAAIKSPVLTPSAVEKTLS